MHPSIACYKALTESNFTPDNARTIVEYWETGMNKLASKSDLEQTEKHLTALISTSITTLDKDLRGEIKNQGTELRGFIKDQGTELRGLIKDQGSKLDLFKDRLELKFKIVNWQFGIIVTCIVLPKGKDIYDFINSTLTF